MNLSRLLLLLVGVVGFVLILSTSTCDGAKEVDDDDFAEFDDDFEDSDLPRGRGGRKAQTPPPAAPPVVGGREKSPSEGRAKQQPVEVVSDDDFEEIDEVEDQAEQQVEDRRQGAVDDEEEAEVEEEDFEGVDDDEFEDDERDGKGKGPPPKLTIEPVPMPARGWQAYWAELLMMAGIGVYMLNYIMGRYKNQKIAQSFFDINWNILEENFTLLGDSTILEDDQGTRNYQRMSDSIYQMWCSGRVCCEGMLLELKLLKRQDLVSILSNVFRPAKDVLRISVEMGKEEMDSFIFAVATKKTALKITKEYNDIANYCPDRKPADKYGLPSQFVVMSEMGEVASSFLDPKTVSVINKFAPLIDCIHVTDQFTGLKNAEVSDTTKDLKPPEPRRFLFFSLNLLTTSTGNNAEQVFEDMKPFFQFVFYTIDKMKRLRLSREGKAKAEKNRSKIEEAFMKQTHAARAEAAAARKEEKRRQEKERILQEDDPEKQRRWEEKEAKREKKRKQPKMKQLKVKAM